MDRIGSAIRMARPDVSAVPRFFPSSKRAVDDMADRMSPMPSPQNTSMTVMPRVILVRSLRPRRKLGSRSVKVQSHFFAEFPDGVEVPVF